jgi:hypothetical protein
VTAPDCPRPEGCPVPGPPGEIDARRLRSVVWPAERPFFHVYGLRHGCDEFNPGHGDTRFAPIVDGTTTVPTFYGGADETVALLESIFHDVATGPAEQLVYERMLRDRGLAHLSAPRSLRLLDLRDPALALMGLRRSEIITASAAHYACTREWALWLHGRRPGGHSPDGLIWHSRQAELVGARPPAESFVLWADRAPSRPGAYRLVGPGVRNLVEGPGRVLVEEIAETLGALVVPG